MNGGDRKNIVIGLAKGYDFETLRPFASTLRRTGYSGDLVFFYADTDQPTLNSLQELGVTLIPFETRYPYFDTSVPNPWAHEKGIQSMGIHCLRYLLAYLYLKEYGQEYNRVMLSDTRDVIFQKDPFDFPGGERNFFLEREGISLAESPVNARWLAEGFGSDVLKKIGRYPIVCSGVTIGSVPGIIEYLKAFLDTIVTSNVPAHIPGMDQGIHNYLVHQGIVSGMLHKNSNGPVFTLGLEENVLFKNGYVYNPSGGIPNVVHQYDRHRRIAKHYWSRKLLARDYYSLWKSRCRRILKMSTASKHG